MTILVPPEELPTYKPPGTTPPVTQPPAIETKNLIVLVPEEAYEGDRITIMATDAFGAPVAGAIVTIDGIEAMTGVDGKANFDGLTTGVKTVLVTKPGYADATEVFEITVKTQSGDTNAPAPTTGYAVKVAKGQDRGMPLLLIGVAIIAITVLSLAYSKIRR